MRSSWRENALLATSAAVFTLWLFQPIRHANDLWWHLASARYMTLHAVVPRFDIFSSTAYGHAWIDHEWLYELLLYAFFKLLGINGALVLKAILIDSSLWIQWLRLKNQAVPTLTRWATLAIVCWASRYAWNERADLVSVLGLSYLMWALSGWSASRMPPRAAFLPVIFLLWANMHGGFLLGLMVGCLYALGLFMQKERRASLTGAWMIVCAMATLLNPYGFQLQRSLVSGLSILQSAAISEWQPTPWAPLQLFWVSFIFFWAFTAARYFLRERGSSNEGTLSFSNLLVALFLSWSACRYVRNVPYFMIAAFPLAAVELSKLKAWGAGGQRWLWGALAATIVWGAATIRFPLGGLQAASLPVEACTYIAGLPASIIFYNDYAFGSYWLWRLAPTHPVFIDGRFHMVQGYPELFEAIEKTRRETPDDWGHFLDEHAVEGALVQQTEQGPFRDPLSAYFPPAQWALVYEDARACVFIKRRKKFASLIKASELPPSVGPTAKS